MRVVVAALLAGLACLFASSAMAENPPPVGLGSIKVVKVSNEKHSKSCSAQSRSKKTTVDRTSRKLAPVACEQPPRSRLLDGGLGFVFVFGA
jgi:hypothetical protein